MDLLERINQRLSERERKILRLIAETGEEGMSVKQIKERVDYSPASISNSLKVLYSAGLIDRKYKGNQFSPRNLLYTAAVEL